METIDEVKYYSRDIWHIQIKRSENLNYPERWSDSEDRCHDYFEVFDINTAGGSDMVP